MTGWDAIGDYLEEAGRLDLAALVRSRAIDLGTPDAFRVFPTSAGRPVMLAEWNANRLMFRSDCLGHERSGADDRFLVRLPMGPMATIAFPASKWIGFRRSAVTVIPAMPAEFAAAKGGQP